MRRISLSKNKCFYWIILRYDIAYSFLYIGMPRFDWISDKGFLGKVVSGVDGSWQDGVSLPKNIIFSGKNSLKMRKIKVYSLATSYDKNALTDTMHVIFSLERYKNSKQFCASSFRHDIHCSKYFRQVIFYLSFLMFV